MAKELKAVRLEREISDLYKELQDHQAKCKHLKKTSEHGANTGHYCEMDDMYWVDHKCLTCLKRWTVYDD